MNAHRLELPEMLRDMPLFVEVAKHKSFTLAAEKLDMYISTLSRRIALLEERLGIALFLRSTRHVELTDSGRLFYDKCRYLLTETQNLYDEVVHNMTKPAGPVRVAVPADVYHTYMWGVTGDFAKKWPDIHLSMLFMHRWVDLLTEPFDIDIRVGPLPDSDLRARKLIGLKPALYASKALLEQYPEPRTPRDLGNMPCIAMPQQGGVWTMWKGKKSESVAIKPVHTVNSISLALELALAGLGVTWLAPAILSHPGLEDQELVPILHGWTVPGIELNLVMAGSQPPHRVRLFADYLVEHFANLPQ
ncbi:MAG: LysR family transcriptional regulator [Deltaproteobacteria bacterium]|nr:LysR family transcriptional regulator [Deltaproteobacteria bacterium]